MKKYIIAITLFIILAAAIISAEGAKEAGFTTKVPNEGKIVKIGISKLLSHPALDAIAKGIEDSIKAEGIDAEITIQNANGDISTCSQIAQLFKSEGMDLTIGIATPTAQALANICEDKPMIYSSVTDPAASGLTDVPSGLVCGVSDMVNVKAHLQILQEIVGIRSVGMIYTSSEANGISLKDAAEKAARELGIKFVSVAVSNSSEVKMAAQSIIDRVDAIYEATDNTVISAINGVGEVCMENGKPLFSADTTSSFGTDVFMAGGFDYYKSGILTGKLVKRVLDGTDPKDIGTLYLDAKDMEIYINLDVAKKMGITVSDKYLSLASYVIENGVGLKK